MVDGQAGNLLRQIGIVGVVFVVLFVAGFLLGSGTPAYDAPDQEWTEWFDDDGNRTAAIIGGLLAVLASLALIGFSALVATVLRDLDRRTAAALVLTSGTAAAVLLAVGTLIASSMAAALTFAPDYDEIPSAELLKAIEQIGIGIWLVGGGWTAGLFTAAVSAGARGTALFAGWLVTAGFVVAALLLLSFFFLPLLLFPLWMLVVSILLLRSGTTPIATTTAA